MVDIDIIMNESKQDQADHAVFMSSASMGIACTRRTLNYADRSLSEYASSRYNKFEYSLFIIIFMADRSRSPQSKVEFGNVSTNTKTRWLAVNEAAAYSIEGDIGWTIRRSLPQAEFHHHHHHQHHQHHRHQMSVDIRSKLSIAHEG